MSDYNPWTPQCHRNWSELSTIPGNGFKEYGITFVYLILASECPTTVESQSIVTCVLFQPDSGSYFECILRWRQNSQVGDQARRNFSIYRYMKSQMDRSLKIIFRFENYKEGRRMLQKNPSSVSNSTIVL